MAGRDLFCAASEQRLCVILLMTLTCVSCASIAHGRTELVSITSVPSEVAVVIDGRQVGITPTKVELSRRRKQVVRFEKPGFESREIQLKRGTSAWLLGDVALGGDPVTCQGVDSPSKCPQAMAFGLALTTGIDYLTGAAFTLPKNVNVTLQPVVP